MNAIFPLHATQQYIGMMIFAVMLVSIYWSNIRAPLALLWGWCLLSAITTSLSPFIEVDYLPSMLTTKTMYSAAQTIAMLVLLPVVVLRTPLKYLRWLITMWAILDMGFLWVAGWGLENGYSFSSALLVCALPLLHIWLWPFVIVTAFKFAGATTMVCLLVVGVSLFWKKIKQFLFYSIPVSLIAIFLVDKYLPEGGLHSSNGRFEAWQAFFTIWWEHMPKLTGTGIGSWEWIGPFLKNPTGQAFQWVHNDFLQMLMEGGIIGLILLLVATAFVVSASWKNTKVRSVALGVGVSMLTYYPLHFVCGMVLILYVTKVAIIRFNTYVNTPAI